MAFVRRRHPIYPLSNATHGMVRRVSDANPILSPEEEERLFRAWREDGDEGARERIILSHVPLAVRMAQDQSGYGLDMDDVLAAAQVGLLRGVESFDTTRGVRFATCAYWTIKDELNNHVMKGTSLLKGSSAAAGKALFYNLRRVKKTLDMESVITVQDAQRVRDELAAKNPSWGSIELDAIIEADGRMRLMPVSFDAPVPFMGYETLTTWSDVIADESPTAEETCAETQDTEGRLGLLARALENVPVKERDRDVFISRRLSEPQVLKDVLAARYGVSRERIRQIEERALKHVTCEMARLAALDEEQAEARKAEWRAARNARSARTARIRSRMASVQPEAVDAETNRRAALPSKTRLQTPAARPDQAAAWMTTRTPAGADAGHGA